MKKGFTLIELVIVAAIVGIIAAIATPNLLVSLQKAKQKSLISKMKTEYGYISFDQVDWSLLDQKTFDQQFFNKPSFESLKNSGFTNFDFFRNLPVGHAACYLPPARMFVKETAQVKLYFSTEFDKDKFLLIMKEKYPAGAGDKLDIRSVEYSNVLSAHLNGSGFEIKQLFQSDKRVINPNKVEKWEWKIKAIEKGVHLVNVELYTYFYINNEDKPYCLKTYEKQVEIKVTASQKVGQFIRNYWQWLFTVILLPILAWVISLIAKWRKKKKSRPHIGF